LGIIGIQKINSNNNLKGKLFAIIAIIIGFIELALISIMTTFGGWN
jgi:hypothetical protein